MNGPRAAPLRALPRSTRRERARIRLVRLVFAIYLLAIFEGSLRKWLLPEYGAWLYFVRDPVLVLAYATAWRHGLWPKGGWLAAMLALAGAGALLVVGQAASGGHGEERLLLAVHGFRSYFLYPPLALVVAAQFRRDDLARLYRLTLWLALPVAVLVVLQFFAPPSSALNVGSATDETLQFRGLTATAEHIRPMGFFSSGAGQQQFVGTAWAVALGLLIVPAARRHVALALLAPATVAVMVCAGVSGSRGTVLQCGLTLAVALGLAVLGRGGAIKGRALAATAILLLAAVSLYPVVLPEGHAAFSERWEAAARVESRQFEGGIAGRALYGLVDFVRLIDTVPLLGYGLGYGTNASITLKAGIDGVLPGRLAETDFARHMVDLGPPFGLVYIAFRLAFAAWLATRALRATRHVADPMPLLLLSYVGVVIATGQITGQGAINVYGWLFAGVLAAACAQGAGARPVPPALPFVRRRRDPLPSAPRSLR